MRQWLFDPEVINNNTPSRKDGIDLETENRYRREGVRLIMDVGGTMKLAPFPTLATAAVYFHRFYMDHSFREFNRYLTCLSCLFLAGKVEETPKKCKDLVTQAKIKMEELKVGEQHILALGRNPIEEVMSVERVLLQTIKFDLQVEHPYQYLLRYAKIFRKNDKEKLQKMLQMAWTFVNDSLCTILCLQWESEVIAIALMYLASRLSKVDITDWQGRKGTNRNEKWWDQFVENMSMDLMEEICHQVLDLYSNATAKKDQQLSSQQPTVTSTSGAAAAASPLSVSTSTPNSSKVSPKPKTQPPLPINQPTSVSQPLLAQVPFHAQLPRYAEPALAPTSLPSSHSQEVQNYPYFTQNPQLMTHPPPTFNLPPPGFQVQDYSQPPPTMAPNIPAYYPPGNFWQGQQQE